MQQVKLEQEGVCEGHDSHSEYHASKYLLRVYQEETIKLRTQLVTDNQVINDLKLENRALLNEIAVLKSDIHFLSSQAANNVLEITKLKQGEINKISRREVDDFLESCKPGSNLKRRRVRSETWGGRARRRANSQRRTILLLSQQLADKQ